MNGSMAKAAAALAAAVVLSAFAVPGAMAGDVCGDFVCAGTLEENCKTCATDCEVCCGDGFCFPELEETCSTCPDDCGTCPTSTTTSTTTTSTTTSDTTTTTTTPTGACCAGDQCNVISEALCQGELLGTYQGDGTSCTEPGICFDCGSGCKDFGESCDDGNTQNGDGCDEKCEVETCFACSEPPPGCLASSPRGIRTACTVIGPTCIGPSICTEQTTEGCSTCGNLEVEAGETCDDGNTVGGDCCSASCQLEPPGSPCADDIFCDGAEICDGEGACVEPPSGPDCSAFDSECALGVCDAELDECVADTSGKDGQPCDPGSCTVANSGECLDGECVGDGTTLSPSCRWIIVGGSPDGPVRVRSGEGSVVDANACGDTAKSAGITSASIVATADTGEGILFYGPPEVAGDIATGGASVGSSLYVVIPGTGQKSLAAGMTLAKVPAGMVDTTGAHPLVAVCAADQDALAAAVPVLDGMTADQTVGGGSGFKVPIGSSATIDITGQGVAVVEAQGLKLAKNSTLTLTGLASDSLMVRVVGSGRFTAGYGAQVVLDGLLPQNVLFYSQGSRCRLSPGVTGAGTIFCPDAGKFVIGVGTNWSGSFLGGAREVQVRLGADLTHVPFTGF